MKKLALFLIGALGGAILCFSMVYLIGTAFEYVGIQLYESEADQQRNFNIVLLLAGITSLAGGLLYAKRFA